MDFQNQIINAIRARNQLKLNYEGEGYRIVFPHILYFSAVGSKLVDAYQISGFSKHSEQVPGWRPFDISKITELTILSDNFEVAQGYNPSNIDRYRTIITKI